MGWFSKRKPADADDKSLHVPPGTAVDPALFPEDDYPVDCLGCGYPLRGLPDGRCPECGREFTRGRLLVDTYYSFSRVRSSLFGRIFRLAAITMFVSMVAFMLCALISFGIEAGPSNAKVRDNFAGFSLFVFGVIVASMATCLILGAVGKRWFTPESKIDAMKAHLRAGFGKKP